MPLHCHIFTLKMAEALGTALGLVGAVGVLAQIFDGCIKAYAFFTTAANLGRDSERLVCKIRIEEMRLLVWGREWGVVEGRLEAHLQAESNSGNQSLRQLAVNILTELHRTITDCHKLQDRYGLREEELSSPASEKAVAQKRTESSSVAGRLRNELQLRAKWVGLFSPICMSRQLGHIRVPSLLKCPGSCSTFKASLPFRCPASCCTFKSLCLPNNLRFLAHPIFLIG